MVGLGHRKQDDFRQQTGRAKQRRRTRYHAPENGKLHSQNLDRLPYTPSSALGSCRYKIADPDVDDTDYKRILEIFKKYDEENKIFGGTV